MGSHGISKYNVTATYTLDSNETISAISTGSSETRVNITGLQSGVSIQVRVICVSLVEDVIILGPVSDLLIVNTSDGTRTGTGESCYIHNCTMHDIIQSQLFCKFVPFRVYQQQYILSIYCIAKHIH